MIKLAALGFFLFWFLATLLRQFVPSMGKSFRWFASLFPIPHWRLFSNPPSTDFQIHYRDRLSDGRMTDWRCAPLLPPRTLISVLWRPHSSLAYFLFKCCSRLMRALDREERSSAEFSRSCHVIRNFVGAHPRSSDSKARQFRISPRSLDRTNRSSATPFKSGFESW